MNGLIRNGAVLIALAVLTCAGEPAPKSTTVSVVRYEDGIRRIFLEPLGQTLREASNGESRARARLGQWLRAKEPETSISVMRSLPNDLADLLATHLSTLSRSPHPAVRVEVLESGTRLGLLDADSLLRIGRIDSSPLVQKEALRLVCARWGGEPCEALAKFDRELLHSECDAAQRRGGLGVRIKWRTNTTVPAVVAEQVCPRSPVERGGLLPGDVIKAVDGVEVTGPAVFYKLVAGTAKAPKTAIQIERNGRKKLLVVDRMKKQK